LEACPQIFAALIGHDDHVFESQAADGWAVETWFYGDNVA
jgi:hypothetical protein